MKKVLLISLIIVIAASALFLLSSCGGNTIAPGAAWADSEVLTYQIIEDEEVIGALVVENQRLGQGDITVSEIRNEPFNISSSATKGLKITQTATINGVEVLKTISVMNGYSPLASYRKINYKNNNYEVKAYVSGKNYHYSYNGAAFKKMNVGSAFLDNEMLYTSVRVYDELDSNYSQKATVVDTQNINNPSKVEVSFAASSAREEISFKYTAYGMEEKEEKVNCIQATITKTTAPIGTPSKIWYTEKSFKVNGTYEKAGNISYHIPVKIVENNLTYKLVSIIAV